MAHAQNNKINLCFLDKLVYTLPSFDKCLTSPAALEWQDLMMIVQNLKPKKGS
jgi:hypothetical protein